MSSTTQPRSAAPDSLAEVNRPARPEDLERTPSTGAIPPGLALRASLLVGFTYVFLSNAWLGDDAFVSFRSAWNLVHGYGLTFNPDERVQAFTNPLWTLVIAGFHAVTGEFYVTALALSYVCCLGGGIVLLRRRRSLAAAAVLVAWLLTSKALVDYTASGLEYPLSFLLLALFYRWYLDRPAGAIATPREVGLASLAMALGFLNRPDAVLLYVLPLGLVVIQSLRARVRGVLPAVVAGAVPAVAWVAFATFYYGFPLPNTFFAKVATGIPGWLVREQGLAYLANNLRYDPLTLCTIALAVAVAIRARGAMLAAALSAVLYVGYTVWAGGDFMGGRFFAMPFLVAVAALVPALPVRALPWAGGVLVLYTLLVPTVPVRVAPDYAGAWPWRTANGVKDEHGLSQQSSNPLGYSPMHPMLQTPFAQEGMSFRAGTDHAAVYCCIGLYGFNAGPDRHVIDVNALSDPLLARLPASPRVYFDFYASHYFRDLPEGYEASVERNANLLADPLLHRYYDRLRRVTRGPLLSAGRLADIWALNVGHDRLLPRQYGATQKMAVSLRAVHERFLTDVGDRDENAGRMRSRQEAGYLQYGPDVPVPPDAYRARWIGRAAGTVGAPLGYVEAWDGDQLIERTAITVPPETPNHLLAALDFVLPHGARHLDYRLWIRADADVSLERVELYAEDAVPTDR